MTCMIVFAASIAIAAAAEAPLFAEPFQGGLSPGWTWVREHAGAWRVSEHGLEIKTEPGNMWGGANDARNVLVRALPPMPEEGVAVTVTVSNTPTSQYEQTNLVWYYDDSHMVKIGLELVDGQLSLVMGREEMDKTRTVALLPVKATALEVRFTVRGTSITGAYRENGTGDWQTAGTCELPVNGEPKLSLQTYQGPADAEHWSRFTGLVVERAQRDAPK